MEGFKQKAKTIDSNIQSKGTQYVYLSRDAWFHVCNSNSAYGVFCVQLLDSEDSVQQDLYGAE